MERTTTSQQDATEARAEELAQARKIMRKEYAAALRKLASGVYNDDDVRELYRLANLLEIQQAYVQQDFNCLVEYQRAAAEVAELDAAIAGSHERRLELLKKRGAFLEKKALIITDLDFEERKIEDALARLDSKRGQRRHLIERQYELRGNVGDLIEGD